MYLKLFLKNNYFCIKFIKVWLTEGKPEIVKNFLLRTLDLQLSVKGIDCFTLEQGLSASFKFLYPPTRLHKGNWGLFFIS